MRLAKVKKKSDDKTEPSAKKTVSPENKALKDETASDDAAKGLGMESRVAYADEFDGDGWHPADIPLDVEPVKAKTEAAREKQMVALAVDLAEKQLREGTASAQVITHYLKLGTEREKLERAILKEQCDLITEKTKALKSAAHMEELYAQAIAAMKTYGGSE